MNNMYTLLKIAKTLVLFVVKMINHFLLLYYVLADCVLSIKKNLPFLAFLRVTRQINTATLSFKIFIIKFDCNMKTTLFPANEGR